MRSDLTDLLSNGYSETRLKHYRPTCQSCGGMIETGFGKKKGECQRCGKEYLVEGVATFLVKPVEDISEDSWEQLRS